MKLTTSSHFIVTWKILRIRGQCFTRRGRSKYGSERKIEIVSSVGHNESVCPCVALLDTMREELSGFLCWAVDCLSVAAVRFNNSRSLSYEQTVVLNRAYSCIQFISLFPVLSSSSSQLYSSYSRTKSPSRSRFLDDFHLATSDTGSSTNKDESVKLLTLHASKVTCLSYAYYMQHSSRVQYASCDISLHSLSFVNLTVYIIEPSLFSNILLSYCLSLYVSTPPSLSRAL